MKYLRVRFIVITNGVGNNLLRNFRVQIYIQAIKVVRIRLFHVYYINSVCSRDGTLFLKHRNNLKKCP